MVVLEQIQKKLAEAIRESELSQTEIARRLNLSQSSIAHYVKGDKLPALDTLANLCQVLDLDANYILCLSN